MILEAIKTFISGYQGVDDLLAFYTDHTDNEASYSIDALPAKTVTKYVDGGQKIELPFIFSLTESIADEQSRIANQNFFEGFSEWLEGQSNIGNLPVLTGKFKASSIEAVNFGYLFETDDSASLGLYQILCKLTYNKEV